MKFIKIFFGICFTLMGLISILPGDAMDASTRNVGIILLIIGILLLRSALKKKKNDIFRICTSYAYMLGC